MFLAPHVQYDGLVVLVSRDGDHAGLAVVPVHGYGGVAPMLKSKNKTKNVAGDTNNFADDVTQSYRRCIFFQEILIFPQ